MTTATEAKIDAREALMQLTNEISGEDWEAAVVAAKNVHEKLRMVVYSEWSERSQENRVKVEE